MASFEMHRDAAERKRSALAAAKSILDLDIYPAHKRELLHVCIWKLTEAESVHKHRTRYRTQAALERGPVQHDHVVQRRSLVQALLDNPQEYESILDCAVACTVTTTEHRSLTRISTENPELEGWHRYVKLRDERRADGEDLIVHDTATGTTVDLEEIAARYSHPLVKPAVSSIDYREHFDALGIYYECDTAGTIRPGVVLKYGGVSLNLYFTERSKKHSFFSAHRDRYNTYGWHNWCTLDSNSARYSNVTPETDCERTALEDLLQFALAHPW